MTKDVGFLIEYTDLPDKLSEELVSMRYGIELAQLKRCGMRIKDISIDKELTETVLLKIIKERVAEGSLIDDIDYLTDYPEELT